MTLPADKIKQRFTDLAKSTGEPYDRLQTLFFLERAALRLTADSSLAKHLIFKGGFVSVRIYHSPRFTKDLDATLIGLSVEVAKRKIVEAMQVNVNDTVWFEFEGIEDTAHQSEYGGTRFVFRAGFGLPPTGKVKAQIVHIDIGTGDPVTPRARLVNTLSQIDDQTLSWQVYPPESIMAEKLHTLATLGSLNSRSKDIYDIRLLCDKVAPEILKQALKATFAYRKDELPHSFAEEFADIDRFILRRGWKTAVGYLKSSPDFDETLDAVAQWLKKHEL